MLFEDERWESLKGAYRVAYDPRPVLRHLAESPSEQAWNELWNELHHQGDVDEASYAAVPVLVEIHRNTRALGWNVYAFCATIETKRHRKTNPRLPEWAHDDYEAAWRVLPALALEDLKDSTDPLLVRSDLSIIAIAKGMRGLGALIAGLEDSELQEILDDKLGWSDLYEPEYTAPQPGSRVRHKSKS